MKILKDGKPIAELPDTPKNFDCGCKDGQITLAIGDTEIKLVQYSSNDTAGAIVQAMCKSYLSGATSFTLPAPAQKNNASNGHTKEIMGS